MHLFITVTKMSQRGMVLWTDRRVARVQDWLFDWAGRLQQLGGLAALLLRVLVCLPKEVRREGQFLDTARSVQFEEASAYIDLCTSLHSATPGKVAGYVAEMLKELRPLTPSATLAESWFPYHHRVI